VSTVDLVPTMLELAGLEADPELPGKSLLPVVTGADPNGPNEAVFAEWFDPHIRMIRTRAWKYVRYLQPADHTGGGIWEELYHLTEDPHEMKNLAGVPEAAAVQHDLQAQLDAHLARTHDPFYWLNTVPFDPFHLRRTP